MPSPTASKQPMDTAGCGCTGGGTGGAYYEELPVSSSSSPPAAPPRRRTAPKRRAPSSSPRKQLQGGRRSWVVALRRAVVRAVAGVTRRRRYIRWAAKLWGRLRCAVAMAPEAAKRPSASNPAYDLAGYARNFDDGAWRDEDDDFWRGGGSFAFRFSKSARYGVSRDVGS